MPSTEFTELVEMLRSAGGFADGANTPGDLAALRERFQHMAATPPRGTAVEPAGLGHPESEWVCAPGADPSAVTIYFHGGAYVAGSPRSHRDLAARLARAAGTRVLNAGYRLAPEDPFPAAVDDAVAAYRQVLASGVRASRVVLAGDSAGGGLALATLVALKSTGGELPAGAAVISPWTDLACTGASITARKHLDPIITGDPRGSAAQYLGGHDPYDPAASPLYADFHGFPPLLVQVGTAEVLFDDSARLAARACEAGVPVCFEPWPDMVHVWHIFAAIVPEAQAALDRMGSWIRARVPAI
ncbi:MAG: alpha/beta hydrolase [Dehalococcoidia bacterium]|nr:alpha/beta hydrolase [Dehalococcoidia bacterium]